jgi:hypothetical protein
MFIGSNANAVDQRHAADAGNTIGTGDAADHHYWKCSRTGYSTEKRHEHAVGRAFC